MASGDEEVAHFLEQQSLVRSEEASTEIRSALDRRAQPSNRNRVPLLSGNGGSEAQIVHSARRAATGSTRDARRAGSHPATSATAARMAAAAA
jgi:hypothetical protein